MIEQGLEASSQAVTVTGFSPSRETGGLDVNPFSIESASGSSLVLLTELAEEIPAQLIRFMEISGTVHTKEASKVYGELVAYLDQTLKRLGGRGIGPTGLPFPMGPMLGEAVIGLSPETIKRIWDNDADKFWDDL